MSILDTLTEDQYKDIEAAFCDLVMAKRAVYMGNSPDWGAIDMMRDAEKAFEEACWDAEVDPEEVLLAF